MFRLYLAISRKMRQLKKLLDTIDIELFIDSLNLY